jgi:hypothetical protein
VFSRRILGWRAATRMTTPLVLDCLEQAIWTRHRDGVSDLSGLVHHTHAGQYTSFAFTAPGPGRHTTASQTPSGKTFLSGRLPVSRESLIERTRARCLSRSALYRVSLRHRVPIPMKEEM